MKRTHIEDNVDPPTLGSSPGIIGFYTKVVQEANVLQIKKKNKKKKRKKGKGKCK